MTVYNDFYKDNLVEEKIKFSRQNRATIKREFKKLVDYYMTHPEEAEYILTEMKEKNDGSDYYSDLFRKQAERSLNDLRNGTFKISEMYILDSNKKIYSQIKEIPERELKKSPQVRIFFYSLLPELNETTGSRLIISALILDWAEYCSYYLAMSN